jgi:hypothetical protein
VEFGLLIFILVLGIFRLFFCVHARKNPLSVFAGGLQNSLISLADYIRP